MIHNGHPSPRSLLVLITEVWGERRIHRVILPRDYKCERLFRRECALILHPKRVNFVEEPRLKESAVLRRVLVVIGTVLVVAKDNGGIELIATGSTAMKRRAFDAMLHDFERKTVRELESAVADLIARATDVNGRINEPQVLRYCKMLASKRAYERREPFIDCEKS